MSRKDTISILKEMHKDTLAVKLNSEEYFAICTCQEGYEYLFYHEKEKEIIEDVYYTDNKDIVKVAEEIIWNHCKQDILKCQFLNYEEFMNENIELIRIKRNKNKYMLFVLDFDQTYDNEKAEDYGVTPYVYLVPACKIKDIHKIARNAHNQFHENYELDLCLGDYFETELREKEIPFQLVGELKIPFEERQCNYLANNVEVECI